MWMKLTDQAYLRGEQYRDSGNLRARMALHERFSTNRAGWHHWVFDLLALAPGARVLELGCGPGELWIENADRLPPALALTFSDYSLGMAREARSRVRAAAPAIAVCAANVDAQALPFADGAFDVVIANHMLYHVPDRARVYAEVGRVLRRGGRFYAATNGAGHMRELDELVAASGGPRRERTRLTFRLDNGGAELAAAFDTVELHHYDDALVIDDAAPLLAYILSATTLDPAQQQRLRDTIERRLAADGTIRVTKETGLFRSTNDE